MVSIATLPLHGEIKMRVEGLRTRDAHIMERIAEDFGQPLEVISRPEPWPRLTLARRRGRMRLPAGWQLVSSQPVSVPNPMDPRRWWVKSLRFQESWSEGTSKLIVWNPLAGAHLLAQRSGPRPQTLFDLLDDWTIHPLFEPLRGEVDKAYRFLLQEADHVTANSEGTVALARRYGRDDVTLIPNGCDVERFRVESRASGPVTVGYGGKLGFRIDRELILQAAAKLPDVRFVLAGPVLDSSMDDVLKYGSNIEYLGDLTYDRYVEELTKWDLGWIPHRVGDGEIGGDIIKQYEYRASALPTFTTPLIGMDRALPGVRVVSAAEMVEAIADLLGSLDGGRVPREPIAIPPECTWKYKAGQMLSLLGYAV